MNTNDRNRTKELTITIPAEIAALPGLNLLEKAALAHIANCPGCSNAGLAKKTGLSVRGVEAMLARLRKRGLIRKLGKGSARRHELTFAVAHHTKCGKTEAVESHTKWDQSDTSESRAVGECKREETTEAFINRHLGFYEVCFTAGKLKYARQHLEEIRARLELDMDMPPKLKAKFTGQFVEQENRCFALEVGFKMAEKLPPEKLLRLTDKLYAAPAEKLALFRQQVEAGQLAYSAINVLAITEG